MSGKGCRRNDDAVIGKALANACDQRSRCLRFSNRDTVEPNYGLTGTLKGRKSPHSFTKSSYVFAVPQSVEKKAGEEDQEAEGKKQAVDEVHR